MPREKQIQPAIVHGYQVPDEAVPEITGAETVVWYYEPDAQVQANSLAGNAIKLPYFFCGNPPEEGKRWPKHRRGGLAFVRNWLAAHAGDKLDRDATAKKPGLKAAAERAADEANHEPLGSGTAASDDTGAKPNNGPQPTDAETIEALQVSHAKLETRYQEAVQRADAGQERADTAEAKLKAERATSRGLRKDLKAAEERAATADKGANDLARRVNNQQAILHDADTTAREQRLALRRILDRATVALRVVDTLQLATGREMDRRDHALAELRSIRALAKELLPGYQLPGDGGVADGAAV